jgi:IclR family transcriptional regulator, pca regulon regulatory protein
MSKYKPITSLQKGLRILEIFNSRDSVLSFQALAFKADMPKTTLFRFLHTLISEGYLSFDSKSGTYALGSKAVSLGLAVLSPCLQVREVAFPYMQELSDATGQTTSLAILDGTEVAYIEHIGRRDFVSLNIRVGDRLNCYQTASGRAILAFLSPVKLRNVIERLLKDAEAVRLIGAGGEKLMAILEKVRRQGYALNDQEFVQEVRAIAAPVFNAQGEIEASVNIPVLSYKIRKQELLTTYLPSLLDTASKISTARGFADLRMQDEQNGRTVDALRRGRSGATKLSEGGSSHEPFNR